MQRVFLLAELRQWMHRFTMHPLPHYNTTKGLQRYTWMLFFQFPKFTSSCCFFKLLLAHATDRAGPIPGKVFKGSTRCYLPFRVPGCRVIHITAGHAFIRFHGKIPLMGSLACHHGGNVYFKPAKAKLEQLYARGLLDKTKFFDERLEVEYYELWHHEGRRARMGTAMMAPDYAWWHGFYECKKRFNNFMEEANHLLESGEKAYRAHDFPNATGNTTKPPELFGN